MRKILMVLLLGLVASPVFAKPKTKVYSTNCTRVWAAVKKAAALPVYHFSDLDDAQKKGIVSTGNAFTGNRYLDITLTGTGETCTVAVNGNYSGLEHDDKGDLYKRIDAALATIPDEAAAPTPTPSAPAPDTKK